jgi:hypothetical protein
MSYLPLIERRIMGTVFKKTATKPLRVGAKIVVRKGQHNCSRLDKADMLADYLGFRIVRNPDAVPTTSTPENLARPTLAKQKKKRKAN